MNEILHVRCPACGESFGDLSEKCGNCGFTSSEVKLYNPRYFILLAAVFSGLVTIYLAASNYGRLGRLDLKRRMLFWGFVGYLVIFSLLILMPDADEVMSKYIGWVINIPVGFFLWYRQKSIYEAALMLGAGTASLLKGASKGFGLAVSAILIPAAVWIAVTEVQINNGKSLLEQERYEEATVHFEKLYSSDPDNPDFVGGLAVCYMSLEEWDKAARCLKAYLEDNDEDAGAHALLGYVRDVQGYPFLAEQHYNRAEELRPGIINEFFDF